MRKIMNALITAPVLMTGATLLGNTNVSVTSPNSNPLEMTFVVEGSFSCAEGYSIQSIQSGVQGNGMNCHKTAINLVKNTWQTTCTCENPTTFTIAPTVKCTKENDPDISLTKGPYLPLFCGSVLQN